MTKQIPLTQGQVALVDDEDFERVMQSRWQAGRRHNDMFYASRYVYLGPHHYTRELLHRFILNAPPDKQVDHIDGNPLNCVRSNLRIASHGDNQHNRGKSRVNKSGYKGIFWHSIGKKWCAQIKVNRHCYHLGLFAKLEDAARAYDTAARRLHGDFAHPNFPK